VPAFRAEPRAETLGREWPVILVEQIEHLVGWRRSVNGRDAFGGKRDRNRCPGEDRRKGYVGLGPADAVPLAKARELAAECRAMLAEKPPRDPQAEFNRRKTEQAQRNAKSKTFYEMTFSYLDARMADPDNPMHISTRTGHERKLKKHLQPLHTMLPKQITAVEVFDIIQPLRIAGRRSTAHGSRLLILRVIEWARANGAFARTEINPASMEEGSPLRIMLRTESTDPKKWSKPRKALHFSKMPSLFARLQNIKRRTDFTAAEASRAVNKARETIYNYIRSGRLKAYKPDKPFSSRSMDYWLIKPEELFKVWPKVRDVIPDLPSVALYVLIYQILTAARPSEVLGMRWEEWKEDIAVWHVPWQRIKQGGRTRQDHYVPLSPKATEILIMLREQQKRDGIWGTTEFVFGSYLTANPTSAHIGIPPCLSTIHNLLERNVDKVDVDKTLHGMRTSFSSWATRLGFEEKDIERGLSHIRGYGGTDVARIYNRDAYNDDGGDESMLATIKALYEDPLRGLFEAWAIYCFTGELPKGRQLREAAEITPLITARWAQQRR
jgi:integrase